MDHQLLTELRALEATPQKDTSGPKPAMTTRAPAHAIIRLQRTIGNQSVQHLIQTKLQIGLPGDIFEQEAERVAEQVVAWPSASALQGRCACGGRVGPDGECAECRKRRLASQNPQEKAAQSLTPAIVQNVLRSTGQALDADTRAFMEPRFGYYFGDVQIHADTQAARSARAMRALAYTVGSHLVFAEGQYAPSSLAGTRLLAHELTHVVQQQMTGSPMLQTQEIGPPVPPGEAVPADDGAKSSAPTPGQGPIPYAHEGEIVCNEDERCWKTVCDYLESGEQACYWQPYVPPPPEGEYMRDQIVCNETQCLQYRCRLSSDGKWTCEWWSLEEPRPESEQPPKEESEQPPKKLKPHLSKELCRMGFVEYCPPIPGPEDMPSIGPDPKDPEEERRAIEDQRECQEKKEGCERMGPPASEMCLNALPQKCLAFGPIWEEPHIFSEEPTGGYVGPAIPAQVD